MDSYDFDIFWSYNRADEDWVRGMYSRLGSIALPGGPIRMFFAPECLPPGALIVRHLGAALRSSRRVIVVLTQAWVDSDWTTFEASIELHQDPAAKQMRILPILLRECAIPPELTRLRNIDFRSEAHFDQAFSELVKVVQLGRAAATEQALALAERERVLNASILPWSPQASPSFRFLWPERFIDPYVQPQKFPGAPERFATWEGKNRQLGAVAIIGAPGGGKTTLLRSQFVRDDGIYSPQIHVLLISAAAVVAQSRRGDPIAYPSPMEPGRLILLDGVDEVGSGSLDPVMSFVAAVRQNGNGIRVACRSDFFFRHIAMNEYWSSLFDEVLELQEWTREDANQFSKAYARQAQDETLYSRALALLDSIPSKSPLWRNPLQLTLLLYLLHSGVQISRNELTYPFALYGVVYRNWQMRERHRGTGRAHRREVESAHVALAQALVASRGEEPPRVRDIVACSVEPEALESVLGDSAFRGLIETRMDDDEQEIVVGFRHETFAEFLIARSIIDAFERGGASIDTALTVTYGSHINRFVRSGLDYRSNVPSSRILANLRQRYEYHLALAAGSDKESLPGTPERYSLSAAIREQLVYYIGRLPEYTTLDFLRNVYHGESSPIIRRSAALGAILHGDEDIETDYLTRLMADPAEDMLNRSIQLIYFLDDKGDFHTYRDRGYVVWRRTRDHIFERLRQNSERDMRLRWWDLATLLAYFMSRPHDRLSGTEAHILANMDIDSQSVQRFEALTRLRDQLLDEVWYSKSGDLSITERVSSVSSSILNCEAP